MNSAAEVEIRKLVARFADAANTANYAAFRALWAAQCEWEIGAPNAVLVRGPQAAEQLLRDLLGPREFFVQLAHSGTVRVDGDRAEGRWYLTEMARNPDGVTFYRNAGVYHDQLVFEDGEWRFARRFYQYIWLDTSPFTGLGMSIHGFNLTKKENFHENKQ